MFIKTEDNKLQYDNNGDITTYDYDFLTNQLVKIAEQKEQMSIDADNKISQAEKEKVDMIAMRDAETTEVEFLLAKCVELGVTTNGN